MSTTYVVDVAPAICAQPLPLPSQRAQAYLYDVGPLSQPPFDVVSVLPTYAWPLTVGAAVFAGAVADVAAVARAAVTLATAAANPTDMNRLMVPLSLGSGRADETASSRSPRRGHINFRYGRCQEGVSEVSPRRDAGTSAA